MSTATSLTESINALRTTSEKIRKAGLITDQVMQSNPLLIRLRSKGGGVRMNADGGERIEIPIRYSGNGGVSSMDEWGTFDDTPQDGITNTYADWCMVGGVTTMSGLQKFQNSGKARLKNLWVEKKKQTADQFVEVLSQDLFDVANTSFGSSGTATTTGNNGNQIIPLPVMVDYDPDRDTPFQARNGEDNTEWQPRIMDFGATGTTDNLYAKMLDLYMKCGLGGGGMPDFGVTNFECYMNYIKHMDRKVRYSMNDEASAGFTNVKFLDMDLFPDIYMCDPEAGENGADGTAITAGAMYMLNSKCLQLWIADGHDFAPQGVEKAEKQYAVREQEVFIGQFTTDARRKQGVLYGITHAITISA